MVALHRLLRMKYIATCFFISLLTSQSLWADVRASVSRTNIQQGDTVTLTILARGDAENADPDLSVLKDNFDILGSGSSQQTSIVNGRRSSSRQWRVELLPRQQGALSIPPITVGQQSTQALTLTVSAQPEAVVAEAGEPVFIKTSLQPSNETVYVQQQLRYTLQLFYRERLYEGSFDGPHVDNALVERLGDDLQYQTTVNGNTYQVIERRYAIFPEQSGDLVISPVTFNGRLAGQSRQRVPASSMNDMMERFFGNTSLTSPGERVRLRGEGYSVAVQPRATSYTGQDWLPGEQLTLIDSWAESPPEFRSGEPVTRTIRLEAKGLESTHLPEFDLPDSPDMRMYPEYPVYKNRTDGEWVYGSVERTFAYVPATAGNQTIPAVTIDWWDTTVGEQRTAQIPAWTVNVLPGDGAVNAQLSPPADVPVEVQNEPKMSMSPEQLDNDVLSRTLSAFSSHWIGLLAGVLLLSGVAVISRRGGLRRKPTTVSVPKHVTGGAVKRACRENNPAAAARALLQWAQTQWPDNPPRNLGSLAGRLTKGVNEIRSLEQALYGQSVKSWQGDALLQVFKQGLQARKMPASSIRTGLSPLYPDWKT